MALRGLGPPAVANSRIPAAQPVKDHVSSLASKSYPPEVLKRVPPVPGGALATAVSSSSQLNPVAVALAAKDSGALHANLWRSANKALPFEKENLAADRFFVKGRDDYDAALHAWLGRHVVEAEEGGPPRRSEVKSLLDSNQRAAVDEDGPPRPDSCTTRPAKEETELTRACSLILTLCRHGDIFAARKVADRFLDTSLCPSLSRDETSEIYLALFEGFFGRGYYREGWDLYEAAREKGHLPAGPGGFRSGGLLLSCARRVFPGREGVEQGEKIMQQILAPFRARKRRAAERGAVEQVPQQQSPETKAEVWAETKDLLVDLYRRMLRRQLQEERRVLESFEDEVRGHGDSIGFLGGAVSPVSSERERRRCFRVFPTTRASAPGGGPGPPADAGTRIVDSQHYHLLHVVNGSFLDVCNAQLEADLLRGNKLLLGFRALLEAYIALLVSRPALSGRRSCELYTALHAVVTERRELLEKTATGDRWTGRSTGGGSMLEEHCGKHHCWWAFDEDLSLLRTEMMPNLARAGFANECRSLGRFHLTSEVITPQPISPTFGYTKEKPPHKVGSWLHDVWSRRLLVACRGGVSWEEGVWTCVKFEWCVCDGWSRWSYLPGGSRMDPCPQERVGHVV